MDEHWDRLERSAATIELPVDRAALEAELPAPPRRGRRRRREPPRRRHSRRPAHALDRGAIPVRRPASVATVTYQPTVILNRVKSLSYAANMHATRIAKERGADEAIFVTPDGVVLGGADFHGLLGRPGRRPEDAIARQPNPGLDHSRPGRPRHGRRGGRLQLADYLDRNRGVHGLDRRARSSRSRRSTARARMARTATNAAMEAFRTRRDASSASLPPGATWTSTSPTSRS